MEVAARAAGGAEEAREAGSAAAVARPGAACAARRRPAAAPPPWRRRLEAQRRPAKPRRASAPCRAGAGPAAGLHRPSHTPYHDREHRAWRKRGHRPTAGAVGTEGSVARALADVQAARDGAGEEAVGDLERLSGGEQTRGEGPAPWPPLRRCLSSRGARLELAQKGEGGRQGARDDVLFGVDLLCGKAAARASPGEKRCLSATDLGPAPPALLPSLSRAGWCPRSPCSSPSSNLCC